MMLAFYDPNGAGTEGNGRWMDLAICWWTRPAKWKLWQRGRFSHVELAFCDEAALRTVCFSSSPRDGGTRFKRIDTIDEKWAMYSLPGVTMKQEEEVYDWCMKHQARKYDWAGVLGFVVKPFIKQNPRKYFCSEICVRALQQVGLFHGLKAWRVSPNQLATIVKEMA